MYAAPSTVSVGDQLFACRSNSSIIPVGGLTALPPASPKKPTTMSFGALVVTEGAMIDLLAGVDAPLCESTGEDRLRPLKSTTLPAADVGAASNHAYFVGSADPATL
jgi:hypothetical protein